MSDTLIAALSRKLLHDGFQSPTDNVDRLRFPEPRSTLRDRVRTRIESLLRGRSFVRVPKHRRQHSLDAYEFIHANLSQFEDMYQCWADGESRRRMVELLAFRILGPERVKLWTNNDAYREALKSVARAEVVRRRNTFAVEVVGHVHHFDLKPLGYPLELHAHELNIINTFLRKQYEYRHDNVVIAAEPSDVVFDCGACWGDSTLYFADRVRSTGKVFAFEFLPSNLAILQANREMNPTASAVITVIPNPVWNASGVAVNFGGDRGPGTTITAAATAADASQAITVTIDEIVKRHALSRVDFLKMDIEGAEIPALQGAAETIRRFKPKLAISAYHKPDDFITIPKLIHELVGEYEFHLDHFTIHAEETVIFARIR